MAVDMSSFIERYQLIYEKDPDSKVFAPLAEAYRRMGLLEEAIDLAERGVRKHPQFASGRVALGKCFFQQGEYHKAYDELNIASQLSPENLLAHQLLGQCLVKLNRPAEALSAFKMVLFLNPNDIKTALLIRDLEQKIYGSNQTPNTEEEFAMESLATVAKNARAAGLSANLLDDTPQETVEQRELALLDSRYERGDIEGFKVHLAKLLADYPHSKEVKARKERLNSLLNQPIYQQTETIKPLPDPTVKIKLAKLQKMLERVDLLKRT